MQRNHLNNYKRPYYVKNFFLYLYLTLVDTLLFLLTCRKKNTITPKKIKNIVISNIGHLGDVLYTLKIIHLLKKNYPKITIDFVGNSSTEKFVMLCPYVSKFYRFDHWMLNRDNPSTYKKIKNYCVDFFYLKNKLKRNSYDLAIDFYPYYPNSLFLLFLSKISFISGFSSGGFSSLLNIKVNPDSNKSILIMNLKLYKKTFDSNDSYYPILKLNLHLTNFKNFLNKNNNNLYILVQPCSGNVFREWPISNWINLCNRLNNIGFICVFLGLGNRELNVCKSIHQNLDQELNINLCNKLDFQSYVSLLKEINYFIGTESFGAHLASSFKKNTFMIKTGTTVDEQWGIFEKNSMILRHETDCYPCFKKNGCASMACIREINPQYVFKRIEKRLIKNDKNIIKRK